MMQGLCLIKNEDVSLFKVKYLLIYKYLHPFYNIALY